MEREKNIKRLPPSLSFFSMTRGLLFMAVCAVLISGASSMNTTPEQPDGGKGVEVPMNPVKPKVEGGHKQGEKGATKPKVEVKSVGVLTAAEHQILTRAGCRLAAFSTRPSSVPKPAAQQPAAKSNNKSQLQPLPAPRLDPQPAPGMKTLRDLAAGGGMARNKRVSNLVQPARQQAVGAMRNNLGSSGGGRLRGGGHRLGDQLGPDALTGSCPGSGKIKVGDEQACCAAFGGSWFGN